MTTTLCIDRACPLSCLFSSDGDFFSNLSDLFYIVFILTKEMYFQDGWLALLCSSHRLKQGCGSDPQPQGP